MENKENQENNKENAFTIDQRLRAVKDTIDKMCYDYWVPLKTVTKTAETYLSEDQATMEKILKEVYETKEAFDELNDLLEKTDEFCDDLDVEIKKAYDMLGLEIPTEAELLGEDPAEDMSSLEMEMEQANISGTRPETNEVTFYEPTPAKPKVEPKIKKLF